MGAQIVSFTPSKKQTHYDFKHHLLDDLYAFEKMLEQDHFEKGKRRIGAEQELVLVDEHNRPAPLAIELLEDMADPHFTNELARFNLEFNLPPFEYKNDCFSRVERETDRLLKMARSAAKERNAEVLLTGILPTIQKRDLELVNMTPLARYKIINDVIMKLRGGAFELMIKGEDDLRFSHDTIMLEACNTSFQVHMQVAPGDFVKFYNIAQAVAGPVLAAAVNSPLLFGKRLWHETRVSVFQQSIETHRGSYYPRELLPRVGFGTKWLKKSVLEIFREDLARLPVLVGTAIDEDALEALLQGKVPSLQALQLFNSTVYRWNRPCYGITDGKPHLRIENRVLPAGPTPVDQVANMTFWFGLMNGLALEHEDISQLLSFENAKSNFLAASRFGLQARLRWLGNKSISAQQLIANELLPIAKRGLENDDVSQSDIEKYLGIIAERAESGQSGASWSLGIYSRYRSRATQEQALSALTALQIENQKTGKPIHKWQPVRRLKVRYSKHNFETVEQVMNRDIVTVGPDEPIEFVANIMLWERLRHIPVENERRQLIGLVSYRALMSLLLKKSNLNGNRALSVKDVMKRKPTTVSPDTPTRKAVRLMQQKGFGCLPVVNKGKLVGVLTETGLLKSTSKLLEEKLLE